jgi:hypothetical protein
MLIGAYLKGWGLVPAFDVIVLGKRLLVAIPVIHTLENAGVCKSRLPRCRTLGRKATSLRAQCHSWRSLSKNKTRVDADTTCCYSASMNYSLNWDLTTIPDGKLRAEWARRNALRRRVFRGGRPRKDSACLFCGTLFPAGERRAHQPRCRQSKLQDLVSWNRAITIIPTFDDKNDAGFKPTGLTREFLYLQKLGYGDQAEVPTNAITNILVPTDSHMNALISVVGDLKFSRAEGRWTFTYRTLV